MAISSYYTNASTMRISGIASGMDTESIITQMLKIEQMKIDRVYQNKTKAEWKVAGYTSVNDGLAEIRKNYLSALSPTNLYSTNAYLKYNTHFQANNFFSVTATAGVIPNNYKVMGTKMATYAKATGSSAKIAMVSSSNASKLLKMDDIITDWYDGNGPVGTNITSPGSINLADIVDDAGNAVFEFDTNALEFTIHGETISLTDTDTLQDLIDEINLVTGNTHVVADFSGNQLRLYNTERGSNAAVRFLNVTGKAFGKDIGFGIAEGYAPRSAPQLTDTVASLEAQLGLSFLSGGLMTFDINGTSITVNGTDTIADMLTEINTSGAGVTAYYDDKTGVFKLRSNNDNAAITTANTVGNMFGPGSLFEISEDTYGDFAEISYNDTLATLANKMGTDIIFDPITQKFEFEINGVLFSYDDTATVNQVLSDVNKSNAGVTMAFSEITKSFVIINNNAGSANDIELKNVGASNAFGTSPTDLGIFRIAETTYSGSDSTLILDIDGTETVLTQSGNTFSIDGMVFTITGEFDESETTHGALGKGNGYSISFTQDTDSVIENVKAFIDDYNEFVNSVYGLITEKKYNDYPPLTEEEKASMTEREIEIWEEKAKSGILRSDNTLRSLLSEMRNYVYTAVAGTGLSPYDIGITTATGTKSGELILDEDVFREALVRDADQVASVMAFTGDGTADSGLMARLSSTVGTFTSNTRNTVIKSQNEQITAYETKIEELIVAMYKKQERLWAQFTAMETALANLNSQSQWLATQLGAMNG